MNVRRCIPWPDPRLRRGAEPVEEITDEVRAIWDDMIDTMDAMPGVGLAAPQIGIMLQLAVVDASQGRNRRIRLANPQIIDASAVMNEHDEASPNLPGVSARISRPRGVTVRYIDDTDIIIGKGKDVKKQVSKRDRKADEARERKREKKRKKFNYKPKEF